MKDPVVNLAARIIKQAAEKTAAEAGDGTTTSIVLAEALVNNGEQYIERYECNKKDVLRNLEAYCEQIIGSLRSKAVDVDGEILVDVARYRRIWTKRLVRLSQTPTTRLVTTAL